MATNSFRRKTIDGVVTYFYNGAEVSKEEFEKQSAEAKQRQTDLLGISKEDFLKETPAQRKKRMLKEMEDFKKGGAVKRYKGGLMVKPKAAKRGY